MSKPARVVLLLLAVVVLSTAFVLSRPRPAPILAAPNIFSGPVNGGCYLQTVTTCAIHVDSWQPVVTDAGRALVGFQLAAQAQGASGSAVLYDFRTDVSNPPIGSYLPSLVKQDFAAQCGVSYHLTLRAQDSGDLSFEETGHTEVFACPAAPIAPRVYLPAALRGQ